MRWLIIILLVMPLVAAEVVRDVALIPITTSLPADGVVEHLFRIENLDHQSGRTDRISVVLNTTVSQNGSFVFNTTTHHIINKFTASTPGFIFGNGTFIVCGAVSSNVTDPNPSNDVACWQLPSSQNETEEEVVPSDGEVDCPPLEIVGLPQLADVGEQLSYRFLPWLAGDAVTYWIEDVHGAVVKEVVTTTRNAQRSYTSKGKEELQVIVVRAVREREDCPASEASALVVVRGDPAAEAPGKDDLSVTSAHDVLVGGEPFVVSVRVAKATNQRRVVSFSLGPVEAKARLDAAGSYELDIPLVTPLDCRFVGEQSLVVKGFGDELSLPVSVVQNPCPAASPVISALSVRAKKYQENVTLFGSSSVPVESWLFGDETPRRVMLNGSFRVVVHPRPGNNTYALVVNPAMVSFLLEDDASKAAAQPRVVEAAALQNETMPSSFVIPASTGAVISETSSSLKGWIAPAVVAVLVGVFLFKRFKKGLRLSSRHGQAGGEEAFQEGDQGLY